MKMFYRDRHGHAMPAFNPLGALVTVVPIVVACTIGAVFLGANVTVAIVAGVFLAPVGIATDGFVYHAHKKNAAGCRGERGPEPLRDDDLPG